ncbi:small nuclear ribonucleo protein-like protein E [Piptocephalis cylindrospora]|uniref:Small nuclear ribonucleoprotein E n=1 Tax=Piptocephalis cylindrospora TaxID=1907219 RepID=A0A4P9Y3P1_9FUNG|nr:small nuclear ribonucleo protein-like protein E [Piptocephalis cylindrospora]|eukprot:RKP13314.1 small nuclear ribonucleo protein-like protein E [Piptocephalis cylindrospora]
MADRSSKVQKVMVAPINLIFRLLQSQTRASIWLYEELDMRLEGTIVGFDEFMNLVLDQCIEVRLRRGEAVGRTDLGRILLKGECITLIQSLEGATSG